MKFNLRKHTALEIGDLLKHLFAKPDCYILDTPTKQLVQVPESICEDIKQIIEEKKQQEQFFNK